MQMEGREDYLHFNLRGEHVLFSGLRLQKPSNFIVASIVSVIVCLAERSLTYALSKHWNPLRISSHSRALNAAWSASLYWIASLLRLLYMLIAMTFHLGLIIVVVTTLAVGQFVIEYVDTSVHHLRDRESEKERSLFRGHYEDTPCSSAPSYPASIYATPLIQGYPRSKSRPDDIFIHPTDSNLARADMAAIKLGLSPDTELVIGNLYHAQESTWELGKGRQVARKLFGKA